MIKRHLRCVDDVAWDGFLHMWKVIGDHASGEASRRMRELAKYAGLRWA